MFSFKKDHHHHHLAIRKKSSPSFGNREKNKWSLHFGYFGPTWKFLSLGSILRQDMKRLSPKPSKCISPPPALSSTLFVCFSDSTPLFVLLKQTSDSIFNSCSLCLIHTKKSHIFQDSLWFSVFFFTCQKPPSAAWKLKTNIYHTFYSPPSLLIHQII